MKKMWKKPELEVLDIRMTMNGRGNANVDCFDVGHQPGENHPGMSNASCLKPPGGTGGSSPLDS